MKGITINPKGFHKDQVKFYIVLIPLALFMALPIVYIINHAFKPLSELYAFPPKFVVENPTIDNFRDLAKVSSEFDNVFCRHIKYTCRLYGGVCIVKARI